MALSKAAEQHLQIIPCIAADSCDGTLCIVPVIPRRVWVRMVEYSTDIEPSTLQRMQMMRKYKGMPKLAIQGIIPLAPAHSWFLMLPSKNAIGFYSVLARKGNTVYSYLHTQRGGVAKVTNCLKLCDIRVDEAGFVPVERGCVVWRRVRVTRTV